MEMMQLVLIVTPKYGVWPERFLGRYMLGFVEVMFALDARGMVIPLSSQIDYYRKLGTSAYVCMDAYKTATM